MPPINIPGWAERLQAIEPSVRLLPRWRIRRVIRRIHGLSPSAVQTAHEDVFVVSLATLQSYGLIDELGFREPLPEKLVLLPLPTETDLEDEPHLAQAFWRRLFHAGIDSAFEQNRKAAGYSEEKIREWWCRRGGTIEHEIQEVVQNQNRLIVLGDSQELFREFVALLLELHFFRPDLVIIYFPGLPDPDLVIREWSGMLDAEAIYQRTRPDGGSASAEPTTEIDSAPAQNLQFDYSSSAVPDRHARVGNDVRSALVQGKQGNWAGAEDRLKSLVHRLRAPLHLDDAAAAQWYALLLPLLEPAAQGFWPTASRLLYELQKACIDVERKVFAVDLVETMVTFGAHKLSRQLTKPRELNILKRLRKAARLADRLDIRESQRKQLVNRLENEVEEAERRVRESLRPDLEAVLTEVHLVPQSQLETIARQKIVEELLDSACARGFLTIGDVRDAIARNRLKLPDLAGPYELITGDELIRANRRLAMKLDGVYHRGEIYMRWLQRLSSLAFGTSIGRFLSLWLILPFLGAYILLEGSAHLVETVEDVVDWASGRTVQLKAFAAVAGSGAMTVADDPDLGRTFLTTRPMVIATALFILVMIQVPFLRRRFVHAVGTIFYDVPLKIIRSAMVQAVFDNALTRFVAWYLLTPLLIGGFIYLSLRIWRVDRPAAFAIALGSSIITAILFRTNWGQGLEEQFNDRLNRIWRILSVNFLFGVLTLIFRVFGTILEWLMRGMYAVDESLRFREGDSSFSWFFKLLISPIWFLISYVIRFAWNLLVEPQINPIKHFPVVTVSHKLLVPLIPDLAAAFQVPELTMVGIVAFIPGIFGFLAWELKTNWKLYRSNQSPQLDAVAVGAHGESMRALLRPGFHSGVVPKTYAKLRRAAWDRRHPGEAKLHHQLQHVADAIYHLVDREMLALLKGSQRWRKLPIHLEQVLIATNSIRIVLMIANRPESLIIGLEEREGWLIGSIQNRGWLDQLTNWQRGAFDDALTGFYKLAGVHFIREETAAFWKVELIALDCRSAGPMLRDEKGAVRYFRYTEDGRLMPTTDDGTDIQGSEIIAAGQIVFSDRPLTWKVWEQRWNEDRKGKEPTSKLDV